MHIGNERVAGLLQRHPTYTVVFLFLTTEKKDSYTE